MKRWIAAWLALMVLFSAGTALASGEPPKGTVEIQEALVSEEGAELGSLGENIGFLVKTLQNEEIRSLLSRDDVKEIFTEVILKVLIWMYENRPVTMKILAEAGVSEKECGFIEKIWDSAEHIRDAVNEYSQTEDMQRLVREAELLINDPDINAARDNLIRALTSEDASAILQASADAVAAGTGDLTLEAEERNVDTKSFIGSVLLRFMRILEESQWSSEYLPQLLKNEKLWNFAIHLANREISIAPVIQEEYEKLTGDPEMMAFFRQTALTLVNAKDQVLALLENIGGEGTENTEEQKEETAQ